MRRHALAACAAAFVALTSNPRAGVADDARCSIALLPEPHPTEFPLLYPPRHDELTLEVGYLGSSFPVVSAVETTLTYSLAPFDQRWHFGLRGGMTAGRWGSDERGPVGLGLGARVAWDFARPLSGVLGIYLLAQGDVILLAADGDPVLRPAAGLGIRVARSLGLEGTFSPLVSLGAPFSGDSRYNGGFGVAMHFDACAFFAFCNESVPSSTAVDLTPQLYSAAQSIARSYAAEKPALCNAVELALDARQYPPVDEGDSARAFLAAVAANVADPALKAQLQALVAKHDSLRDQLVNPKTGSRVNARWAAQSDRLLVNECIYSPFPVEIRAAFGC
jgi:hypothetical protein